MKKFFYQIRDSGDNFNHQDEREMLFHNIAEAERFANDLARFIGLDVRFREEGNGLWTDCITFTNFNNPLLLIPFPKGRPLKNYGND